MKPGETPEQTDERDVAAGAEKPGDECEAPQAAPTDYYRNRWILYVLVGMIVLAWLLGLLSQ